MKNKRIPKTLPKFSPGGKTRTLLNGNVVSDAQENTQNIYNEGRSNKINAGQYAQYGQAAMGLGSQFVANSQLTGEEKQQANSQTMNQIADTAIQAVPGFGQYYGFMKGASDVGKSMLAKDEYGNYKTGMDKAGNEIMTADHAHMINDISNKNYTALGLDTMTIGKFARMFSDVTGNSQKTDGGWGKFNKFVGITPDTKYPNGGMNTGANAEIEKQENVVAPNGGFLQADGPSHEQGGVPVKLPGNSMIFSDRLKAPGTKKTFADLNKINNTTKEDKILESDKHSSMSKRTAELMKFVKNKNSESLFNEQESLKQAKVEAYAKKMGVTLPQTQETPQEFAMGGVKLPMYPYGGPTDNIKFTPAQRQQAYADSMTLYKSGFNKNIPNWKTPGFNEAVGRLHTLNGVVPQSTDKSSTAYANDANYLAQRSVPYAKPTAPVTQIPTVKSKPVYGNINMPMKGLENNVDINPQLQTVPTNRPSTIKTNIVTGPNMSYKEYKQGNEVLDRAYFDPSTKKEIELTGFRYGGKLPKYTMGVKFTPKMASEDEGDNVIVPGNKSKTDSDFTEALGPDPHNTFGKPLDNWDAARLNKSAWDADYLNNPNAERPVENPESSKFDWKGLGSNVAMGLANNAGNIYNLSRYNKPEIEKYERMKATYLDPSAALRDATEQTRRAEYNVRGASGGNAGTYLSNRVALNAQNIINKDRIQKEYQNVNAAIANNVGQYNNELARQEVIANAMNRARTRSGKGEAIGSMGSNIANQMMDNKKTNMDQETLQLMMKYYNDPQFKKYLEESGFNKKKIGK